MVTGELKSKIDKVGAQFWTGGLSNPITVMEKMTFQLLIKWLDDIHTQLGKRATFIKQNIEYPAFSYGKWCRCN